MNEGLGLGMGLNLDKIYLNFTLLTETVDSSSDGRYPWQLSLLAVYRPILEETEVFHFAGSFVYQIIDDSDSFNLASRTSTNSNSSPKLFAGELLNIENYSMVNNEFIYLRDAFDFRSEFAVIIPSNTSEDNFREFYSFYASLSYFINGGSSNYQANKATFGRPNLSASKYGTWQLAARYSLAELSNIDFGQLDEGSFAVNLFLNKNLRFTGAINYSHISGSEAADEEILGGQLRGQLAF